MSTIIAGRFDTQEAANEGIAAITRAGFAATDVQSFYVTEPGMHGNIPVVDNDNPAVGTHDAPKKAAAGAVIGGAVGLVAGLAAAPLAAPAVAAAGAIAGTGVGAYGGSLVGSMQGTGAEGVDPKASHGERIERRSGIMVAICADSMGADQAIQSLRSAGAKDIERATGTWSGGWADFDSSTFPDFVDAR